MSAQQTVEWLMERVGNVTGSRVKDVIAKLKNGKSSQARETYKMELLCEILTGRATEHYVSQSMEWGTETEPLARSSYEIATGNEVELVGYVKHSSIPRFGGSPDGLVGTEGLVEFKCPNTTTHLRYFLDGIVAEEYIPQMNCYLACTGRKWADFVSYDPRLPQEYGLFIVRLERDENAIASMELEVIQFIKEINEMAENLLRRKEAGSDAVQFGASSPAASGPKPECASIPEWEEAINEHT